MKHINSQKMRTEWRKFWKSESEWPGREKGQKRFRLLSRQILIELMKKPSLSNVDLTALVQMFKWSCTEESFLKHLNRLKLSSRTTSEIQRSYERLPQITVYGTVRNACGFTAAGLWKIRGLSATQRRHVRTLLRSVAGSKSVSDVMEAVAAYEQHSVPVVSEGIYSPWLHSLKPKLCPLVNNAIRPILTAGRWGGSYCEAMLFYARVARIVGQSDLADIDRCFLSACEKKKKKKTKKEPSQVQLLRKRFFDSFDDPEDEKEEQIFAGDQTVVTSAKEGRRRLVSVSIYERDNRLRLACKTKYGTNCAVCGLAFGRVYGERADGFIHIHHLRPLSESGKVVTSSVRNLRPVCPNCHAILHRGPKLITINRLKKEMAKAKAEVKRLAKNRRRTKQVRVIH